jgi:hypothetical protein
MDDFLVDSQKLAQFLIRRKALLLLGALCLLPTSWCRQQQLLQTDHILRRGLERSILTLLARILRLHAQTGIHHKRMRPTARR